MRTPTTRIRRHATALLAVAGLLLAACSGTGPEPDDDEPTQAEPGPDTAEGPDGPDDGVELHVVATTSILGDILAALIGDDGQVTVLMPPGVDPHGYQPSAADASLLRAADLVVANGLQLEEGLMSALDAASADGATVITIADRLDPLAYDGHADDHGHDDADDHGHDDADDHAHDDADDHAHDDGDDHGHDDVDDHDHGEHDPHVWFDPVRMADGVRLIAAELARIAPDVDAWTERGEVYAAQLLAVHEEMEARLATIPAERRKLVTNHDALGYLAARYDLEVIGTVIPGTSTQAETDPRHFAELVETVEAAGVPAIFADITEQTTLAEQLRSELRSRAGLEVEVVALYTGSLGPPGSGAETYLDLLRTTARQIAEALA